MTRQSTTPKVASEKPEGLRERRRNALVDDIHTAALRSFDQCGYEDTSLQALSDEVGISLRTLFRHFGTKEAIFAYGIERRENQILVRLKAWPAGASVLEAYLGAIDPMLADWIADPRAALREHRILEEVPSLRAYYLAPSTARVPDGMDEELARRLGCERGDLRVKLFRSWLLNSVILVAGSWLAGDTRTDLRRVMRENLFLLSPVATSLADRPR